MKVSKFLRQKIGTNILPVNSLAVRNPSPLIILYYIKIYIHMYGWYWSEGFYTPPSIHYDLNWAISNIICNHNHVWDHFHCHKSIINYGWCINIDNPLKIKLRLLNKKSFPIAFILGGQDSTPIVGIMQFEDWSSNRYSPCAYKWTRETFG